MDDLRPNLDYDVNSHVHMNLDPGEEDPGEVYAIFPVAAEVEIDFLLERSIPAPFSVHVVAIPVLATLAFDGNIDFFFHHALE